MNKKQILETIQKGAKVFDVRSPEEYRSGAYPNAVNVPVQQLPQRIEEFGAKDRPIVVYCQSGGRSSIAASILKASGYKHVVNAGGISDMPS